MQNRSLALPNRVSQGSLVEYARLGEPSRKSGVVQRKPTSIDSTHDWTFPRCTREELDKRKNQTVFGK